MYLVTLQQELSKNSYTTKSELVVIVKQEETTGAVTLNNQH